MGGWRAVATACGASAGVPGALRGAKVAYSDTFAPRTPVCHSRARPHNQPGVVVAGGMHVERAYLLPRPPRDPGG